MESCRDKKRPEDAPAAPSALRRLLGQRWAGLLAVVLINAVIFASVDLLLVKLDILRPPFRSGDAELGFGGKRPFLRSRDLGVDQSFSDSLGLVIAMVGDSHSEVSPENALRRHQFVFEKTLRDSGIAAAAIVAGRGKYSPLQEYLLYKLRLKNRYGPNIVVMNLYTGNDFYDMLRPDDRPHFARDKDGAIEMRPPVWLAHTNPDGRSWPDQSRVLWTLNQLAEQLGYPRIFTRLRMLSASARGMGGGITDVYRYTLSIRRSIEPRLEYNAGFSAQILNQAVFFEYFPRAKAESLFFMRHLLETARRENPGVKFVMAPIPSALLAKSIPEKILPYWKDTLGRVGLAEETVYRLEADLYEELRVLAVDCGWIFVDLLPVLIANPEQKPLYTERDLHVNEASSRLIGRKEARVLQQVLRSHSP